MRKLVLLYCALILPIAAAPEDDEPADTGRQSAPPPTPFKFETFSMTKKAGSSPSTSRRNSKIIPPRESLSPFCFPAWLHAWQGGPP